MEKIRKVKKKYKAYSILVGCIIVLSGICLVFVEILSNLDGNVVLYLFLAFFLALIACIILVVYFYRSNQKIEKKLFGYFKSEIPLDYSYNGFSLITELIQECLFPCKCNVSVNALESISGWIETTPFEYYLCYLWQDSLLKDMKAKKYDFFIFKNINISQEDFIATNLKIKLPLEFRLKHTKESYTIYSKDLLDVKNLNIPKDSIYMAYLHNTLYILRPSSRKKAIYLDSETKEEFQMKFSSEIEETKAVYETMLK